MNPVDPRVQEEREAQFARNIDAFIRRDFGAIEETMRPDVTLEMPGSSWVAGTYRGLGEVGRGVVALRQVFNSDTRLITFLHEGDQMLVRHAIQRERPTPRRRDEPGCEDRVRRAGKFAPIDVEPADIDLFDYVVNSRLNGTTP